MQPIGFSPLFILALGTGGFVMGLIGLTAFLSILRQRRVWKLDQTLTPEPAAPAQVPAPVQEEPKSPAPVKPVSTAPRIVIEPKDHLPVREGTPDQVVIQIDAPEGPNRNQVNVQRLIDYLKSETVPTNGANSQAS